MNDGDHDDDNDDGDDNSIGGCLEQTLELFVSRIYSSGNPGCLRGLVHHYDYNENMLVAMAPLAFASILITLYILWKLLVLSQIELRDSGA